MCRHPMSFHDDIITLILNRTIQSPKDLQNAKIRLCKTYQLNPIPTNADILAHLPKNLNESDYNYALKLLQKKPMRTKSGVAIIAVMTSPHECPHGRCTPCPGGPTTDTPQSYTGHEPAAMRAENNNYDPFLQTTQRLTQLQAIGHSTNKIDFIIMGGTFTARHPDYQEWFVKRCFDAMNQSTSDNLKEAQIKNETANNRCIGLTVETRPDWFRLQHIDSCLHYGATRVELGVQIINDDILSLINRGHSTTDTIQATQLGRNCGFKICYHLMPGLPGVTEHDDLEAFQRLFSDQRFKPDMIKIYPALVIKGTELYTQWEKGIYEPLSDQQAAKRIAKMLKMLPRWVRIQRVQRDVPAPYITAGVTKSNLRQLVHIYQKEHHTHCHCIRCRELGHTTKTVDLNTLQPTLCHNSYQAADSTEHFLSMQDINQDILIGYLRLRHLKTSHREELNAESTIIRELKVVGSGLTLGQRKKDAAQHKGYGKALIAEAERITKEEYGLKTIHVISGIGVKEYYRKLGYNDNGAYLSKTLA